MSQFSFDVSLEEFEAKVIVPSQDVPIVVDFWAPWCEPCKVLKPLLEKLAEEYAGRFLLAMVNADENPEISQHFGVRSIPSVKVLYQGQLVDEFTGALKSAPSSTALRCRLPSAATCAKKPLRYSPPASLKKRCPSWSKPAAPSRKIKPSNSMPSTS